MPCQGGTLNCSVSNTGSNGVLVDPQNPNGEAWTVTSGYDLVTGLGSVNAQNLVNNWFSTFSSSATALSASVNGKAVNTISGIAHGTPIAISSSVTAGPGAIGTPTGQVALIATPNPIPSNPSGSLGIEALSLINGNATSNSVILPGGTYNLSAHYPGDGTFGVSDSSPAIPVNITSESSKTLISIPVFDPTTGRETGNNPTTLVYASPYIARIDVGNSTASLIFPPQPLCTPPNCPTGTITLTDSYNGGSPAPLDGGTFPLNSGGFADDLVIQLPGGTHQLSASYGGDNSFNASSNSYTLTVTPAPTITGPGNPPLPSQVVTPFGLGAIIRSQNFGGAMESCNVTFLDGNTPVPGTVTCSGQTGGPSFGASIQPSLIVNQTTAGTHTYTTKFNGDANYALSTSAPMTTIVFYGTTVSINASSTNIQYGSSITLTALVDSTVPQGGPPISQNVTFYNGFGPTAVTGTVSYTAITDSSGNVALQATIATIPQSSGFFTATFAGDQNYFTGGTVNPVNVTVNIPDFSLSANLPTSSITAGNSAAATITITPASSASSPVTLTCPPLNLLGQAQPAGISCSFSPNTVNLSSGSASSSTLMISTVAPSSSTSTSFVLPQAPPLFLRPRPTWPLATVSVLLLLLLLWAPVSSRRGRLVLGSALACYLPLFLGLIGCGGGGAAGAGGGGGGGPIPTSISLSTPSVKVPFNPVSGVVVNLTANVTSSKPPGGTVTVLVDGSNGFSVNNPVVNGVAQFQITGLSVGVHTFTAQYSGDANTLSSQTKGSLNIAVTGQTEITVRASTGGLSHSIGLNFTLQ